MPAKPESNFVRRVNDKIPKEIYREKMSNPYRSGTVDHWYSGPQDLWVEYKFVVLPKRKGTYIDFGVTPLQRRWIESRRREGRRVWLIVGCVIGGAIYESVFPDGARCDIYLQRVKPVSEVAQVITFVCNGGHTWQSPSEVKSRQASWR